MGPLLDYVVGNVPWSGITSNIQSYALNHASWNVKKISHFFHASVTNRMVAMASPFSGKVEDTLGWKHTNDGNFSLVSVYDAIQNNSSHPFKKLFMVIWKWPGP